MKIVSGIGSIDEYVPFVEAGADEFFCGYVPAEWNEKYGTLQPLNRREVMNYNVQLGSLEELKILHKMIDKHGVPVKLALNSLYYSGKQYEEIAELVRKCMGIGFDTFIIADPALILYLREQKIACKIHLSGETSEVNSLFLKQMEKYQIRRVIFHRKNTLPDMKSCIDKSKNEIPEYEVFILNEQCHFTGAYCSSLHCDELCHLCLVPYELGTYGDKIKKAKCGVGIVPEGMENGNPGEVEEVSEEYRTGDTGCGLCALYQLQAAGVSHLKVVGRGNYTEYARQDILQLRKALDILEECYMDNTLGDVEFQKRIKKELFEGKCSNNCYYREVKETRQ